MKKKLQVFISSTYLDLQKERQAAVEAIIAAGHIPAGMELFSAGSESQWEVIRRWIDESDVFLLILGGRYGTIEPKSGESYIQLEYEYAASLGKPFFAVIMTDLALDDKVKDFGRNALELENPEQYKTFKELVKSKMCKFFEDTKDIRLAIYETLADFQNRYPMIGWVSGKDIVDSEKYITEIARLLDDNNKLKNEARELTIKIGHIKNEYKENKGINTSISDSITDRVGRIVELSNGEKIEGEPCWMVDGEIIGETGEIEQIEFEAKEPRGEFEAYLFLEDNNKSIKYLGIILIDEDESFNLNTALAEIRMMLNDYKKNGDMTYRFILVSTIFTDELKDHCYRFFDQAIEMLNLDTELYNLEVWDKERISQLETDLGLFLALE